MRKTRRISSRSTVARVDVPSLLASWMRPADPNSPTTGQGSFLPHDALVIKTHPTAGAEIPAACAGSELATGGAASFVEAQNMLLQLVKQYVKIGKGLTNERVTRAGRRADLIQNSLDMMLRLQRDFLETTEKQTLQWLTTAPVSDTCADRVCLAREAVMQFVKLQASFLAVIADETSDLPTPQRSRRSRKARKPGLKKLAESATSAFADAQTKLLKVLDPNANLLIDQENQTTRFASVAPSTALGGAAREAVRRFIGSEKALIEAALRPFAASKGNDVQHDRRAQNTRRRNSAA